MAGRIDYQKTFLGRVQYLTIDGIQYPVADDGVTITQAAQYIMQPVVGSLAPRVTVGFTYYRIDAVLPENILQNLQIAWNLGASAWTSYPNFDQLNLATFQTVTTRALTIVGTPNNTARTRIYTFPQCCLFEPKPQVLVPTAPVKIPVSFYAYGSDSATAGQEFGTVQQTR